MSRQLTPHRDRPAVVAPLVMVVVVGLAGCAGTGLAQLTKPQPYTESGAELNGTDLREAHLSGLREAGSFQSTTTLDLESNEHAVHVDRSTAADLEANRSLGTTRLDSAAVEGEGLVITTYTGHDTTYRRAVADVGNQKLIRYDAARAPYTDGLLAVRPVNTTRAANADLIATVVDGANWTQRGVERHDGGWVTRYEVSGPENVSGVGSPVVDAGRTEATDRTTLPEELDIDVTSINATLLVGPDGVVRRLHVHMVGTTADQPVEMTLVVTTRGIGTTAVERPPWLENARTKTNTTAR